MSGYNFAIVHSNKRWGFSNKDLWEGVVDKLEELRKGGNKPDEPDNFEIVA
jgi:hypothetical protein